MSRPPVRVDKGFLFEKENYLKLGQLVLGLASLAFAVGCYPNAVFQHCEARPYSWNQLFVACCANGFFAFFTLIFTIAHLCSLHDVYYHFNFPILEKLYASMATVMYLIGFCVLFASVVTSPFVPQWLFIISFNLATFGFYGYDAYLRWTCEYTF
uniref:MARVEL domain-containing protein n=1 Tax=Steinernema glaseri TaxID=37863 RepID=A0A1I7ZJQ8_9BILA